MRELTPENLEKRSGAEGLGLGNFLGWALGDDLAAGFADLGGDGHVVLDDDDGVAFNDEAV